MSTFLEYYQLNENVKQRVEQFKIQSPYIMNFIALYEEKIDWGAVKTEEDINKQIRALYKDFMKDKESGPNSLYSTEDSLNWNRIIEVYRANPDPNIQASLQIFDKNPKEGKKRILDSINHTKRETFKEWNEYLTNEPLYQAEPAFQYVAARNMLNVSSDAMNPPEPLNPNVLAKMFSKIGENYKTYTQTIYKQIGTERINRKGETVIDYTIARDANGDKIVESKRFAESYKDMSREFILQNDNDEKIQDKFGGTWICIEQIVPSTPKDVAKERIDKLRALSAEPWCTKQESHAQYYLKQGNFWLYIVGNVARLAVRLLGDSQIAEIRGDRDGGQQNVDWGYEDHILEFVETKGFVGGKSWIDKLKKQTIISKINDGTAEQHQLIAIARIHSPVSKYVEQGDTVFVKAPDDNPLQEEGDFTLTNLEIERLLFSNWHVEGSFYCSQLNLKHGLEGFPKFVGGNITMMNNGITSLKGIQQNEVYGYFAIGNSNTSGRSSKIRLKNLEGMPQIFHPTDDLISGIQITDIDTLTSLKGAPKEVSDFVCIGCPNLTDIKDLPQCPNGTINLSSSGIENLEAPAKIVADTLIIKNCTQLKSTGNLKNKIHVTNIVADSAAIVDAIKKSNQTGEDIQF